MGSIDPRRLTTLYRLFDADGRLLYVGTSVHPQKRWEQHAATKPWWSAVHRATVEWLPGRDAALAAEREAIAAEAPLHNDKATEREVAFPYQGNRGPTRETLLRRAVSDFQKASDRLAVAVDRASLDGLSRDEIAAIAGGSPALVEGLFAYLVSSGGRPSPP
ncbi:GIY-YIG nuclease family protein [Streptomyces sp. CACIS-1.16CA]|uniref:GIY-YIG nuclease family protein n=1 Tax=Streptomyces sp. CACIS-1.16CA TaxID=1175510 RepID=UPI0037D4774B